MRQVQKQESISNNCLKTLLNHFQVWMVVLLLEILRVVMAQENWEIHHQTIILNRVPFRLEKVVPSRVELLVRVEIRKNLKEVDVAEI